MPNLLSTTGRRSLSPGRNQDCRSTPGGTNSAKALADQSAATKRGSCALGLPQRPTITGSTAVDGALPSFGVIMIRYHVDALARAGIFTDREKLPSSSGIVLTE